jgi:hypothetical protein
LQILIQRRMRELGMESWSELGRKAGLPRSTVWALGTTEHRTTLPKDTTLEAVAKALGLTAADLRHAAYDALGPIRAVRIVGTDFESLPEEDQEELNGVITQMVSERLDRLRRMTMKENI